MKPAYDLDKIKFATDGPTFQKAVGLYKNGKITQFEIQLYGFSAIVFGTKAYRVHVDRRHYDQGNCECYLGQNDTLCKHMVAVALWAVAGGEKLTDEDIRQASEPVCSGRRGILNKEDLLTCKNVISASLRYVKPYNGPSRIWFSYQNSLSEGCNRLAKIISEMPVSEQTAQLLVNMLLRLDRKLCEGGIDDSDGTVGGFMEQTVVVLQQFSKLESECSQAFKKLRGRKTCFDWEEPLLQLLKI